MTDVNTVMSYYFIGLGVAFGLIIIAFFISEWRANRPF